MSDSTKISIRELVIARLEQKSDRNTRQDKCHLALVIEGGGMRGVVAGGMVAGLQQLGLLDCFDSIHGSSAGACAGAYFIAGQSKLGTTIFYEDINNSDVVNPARLWIGRAVMNARYITHHVMRITKPLNVERIIQRPDFLHIVSTTTDAREHRSSVFSDADDFFAVLQGTITMPILGGKSVYAQGENLVDGGMVQQIPFRSALQSCATHILVLLTRREGEHERVRRAALVFLEAMAVRAVYGGPLARLYRSRRQRINSEVDMVLARNVGHPVVVDYIARPASASRVRRFSLDPNLLRGAEQEAGKAVINYFG
jgi:predicted patatin/cPLA2 family phospholipase